MYFRCILEQHLNIFLMRIVIMIILRKDIYPCKQVRLDKTMGRLSEKTALVQFYQLSHVVAYIHSR